MDNNKYKDIEMGKLAEIILNYHTKHVELLAEVLTTKLPDNVEIGFKKLREEENAMITIFTAMKEAMESLE